MAKVRAQHRVSDDDGPPAEPEAVAAVPVLERGGAFSFEIEMEIGAELPVFEDSVQLHGRLRHGACGPVVFGGDAKGSLNVGLCLHRGPVRDQVFEDRMEVGATSLDPGVWTSLSLSIPGHLVNFTDGFRLRADIVSEEQYWFSPEDAPAFERDVCFVDGSAAAETSVTIADQAPAAAGHAAPAALAAPREASVQERAASVHLVFDVSDLVQYFQNARLPTGIQRVQIEVITNLIAALPEDCSLKIACFTKQTNHWVDLPPLHVNHVCKLALVSGDTLAPDWRRAIQELQLYLAQSPPLVFRHGAYLINLGTSWWLQNYFLHVRAAKAQYGIRYIPYVHDCIPIMVPEHCVEGLTRDFVTWTLGAFQHADHIIVNSKATAADVKRVAARLGHHLDEPSIVTLDADYRAANTTLPTGAQTGPAPSAALSALFLDHGIQPDQYVLFVSTIESRKNHLMAFSAWLALAKKHGVRHVPKLVCVGSRGWLNDAIYAKLAASKVLQQKVVMLSKISDPDLELLYRNCLFTLYPSSYEGWGLPVTESLCFGKVPVLADSTSLPEAGGAFGAYFDLGSETALLQVLERMIFDVEYRLQRERDVAAHFRPRTWSAIAADIVTLARGWAESDPPVHTGREAFAGRFLWPFPAEPGRYYGLTENPHTVIWKGMTAGEMFRQGDGWWWPEPWGCWTKTKTSKLAFLAPMPLESGAVIFVGVRGVQRSSCTAEVRLAGGGARSLVLGSEERRWLVFRLSRDALAALPRAAGGSLFEFRFSSDGVADFREFTGGVDHRVTSIGVCGFMACSEGDVDARMRLLESVALDDLAGMSAAAELEAMDAD